MTLIDRVIRKGSSLRLNRVTKRMDFFLRGTDFELIQIIDGKLLPKMTFYKFSLNKQVSQTGLFIVELTALILFSCDHLSFAFNYSSIDILGCRL